MNYINIYVIIMTWLSFIKEHLWEIAVVISVLILLLIILFRKHLTHYLKDKEDFYLPPNQKALRPYIKKKYETKCREIFESIFQRPFPSARPQFLKRKNGFCLELDGWNPSLQLAFEFNGIQHSKFSRFFHRSYDDFQAQLQRDMDKKRMCQEAGVTLITIPHNIKYDMLEAYIRHELNTHYHNSSKSIK